MNPIPFFVIFLLFSCQQDQVKQETKNDPVLRFQSMDSELLVEWVNGPFPSTSSVSKLRVLFPKEGASLLENHFLEFDAHMPSMTHGLDDPGFFESQADGSQLNSSIRFQMSGEWEMKVLLIDQASDQIVDQVKWLETIGAKE